MIITQKTFSEEQLNIIKNLSSSCNICEETAKILYARGYTEPNLVKGFLYPTESDLNDPYLLKNMSSAVERINLAKENGETVVVYGDYDADGVCSTTVLYKSLLEFGIDAITVVPERENGYGLSTAVIDEVLDNYFPDLIITVDCGISNHDEIEYLKDLGVDVIVTDHHEIPEILPECLVVNCKIKDQAYPFDCLSGAGVAYKLACALIGDRANKYLDLVALATVADSMPLISENRIIVKMGLEVIKGGKSNKALKSLINLAGVKEITSGSLAFGVAPRINAGGRMGDAYSSLKLLLSENFKEIEELSNKLIKYNVERQLECEELYLDAKDKLKNKGNYGNVIVLAGDYWKTGLVGIVAAKISEEYNLPTILFSKSGDSYHGSARSIAGVNVYEVIKECGDLLLGFGGHSQAAGVTVSAQNLDAFAQKLSGVIGEKTNIKDFERTIEIDGEIKGVLSKKFLNELNLFEPCGIGNKKPIFLKVANKVNANIIKNSHLSFNLDGFDYMYFNGINDYDTLSLNSDKYLIVEPNISLYNGREYTKAFVKKIVDVRYNLEDIYSLSLINALENAKGNNSNDFESITNDKALELLHSTESLGFGRLFVLNDPKNKELIKGSKLSKFLVNFTEKTGKNAILIGGIKSQDKLDGYKEIIHLDTPLSLLDTGVKTFVNKDLKAFDLTFNKDRNLMISVYKTLVEIISKGAKNLIDAYQKSEKSVPFEVFAFAGKVFEELGFIIQKDILYLDKTIKRDLTESKIYTELFN